MDKENRFVETEEGGLWKALAKGTCSLSFRFRARLDQIVPIFKNDLFLRIYQPSILKFVC